MIRADFHTHTAFSDGKNTPEEMVLAAIQKGMTAIGFSDHSYTSFDPEPCMKQEAAAAYQAEIRRLQASYQDTPYPAPFLLDYIHQHGGKFILSSDSHRVGTLTYQFDKLAQWNSFSL